MKRTATSAPAKARRVTVDGETYSYVEGTGRSARAKVRRRSNRTRTAAKTAPSAQAEFPQVVRNGKTTHVLIPIDEYERLLLADMTREAVGQIKSFRAVDYVDADHFRLELAAERITKARKAAGLTQTQLGRKLGIPQSQISRIERNPDHTTVRTLKRIAKALKVNVQSLI